MALPFPDASFDVVISRHLLWSMSDPAQALREWIRVVQPGGRIFWVDATTPGPAWIGVGRRWAASLLRLFQRMEDHVPGHRYDEEMYARMPLHNLRSWTPIRDLLADLGVEEPRFRSLPALDRAERASWPRHRQLSATSRGYVGSFTITSQLHNRFTRVPQLRDDGG